MANLHKESFCVHGGYRAKGGQPQELPIVQSTTYRYDDPQDVADLFDLKSNNFFYTRIGNPTVSALEEKMTLLEGGVGAVATSSGQAATLLAVLNIAKAGDHILCSAKVYGGTTNLLAVTLKRLGIETTFFDPDLSEEEIVALGRANTRLLFGESIGNPAINVLDIEKFARAAGKLGIPLFIDNTIASPYLCNPIQHGANVVLHSATKYCDGHATSVGGMIIDGGNFDWKKDNKYPGLFEPDDSYHGLIYTEAFGKAAFAVKARAQMLRDLGATMAPMNAFLTNLGLETLHLRMERHSENAQKLAEHLEKSPYVEWVNYPGLSSNPYHELAKKYLPRGCGGTFTFEVKGGVEAGIRFIQNVSLTSLVVHVGDLRTSVLHPASTTHRQLTEEAQRDAGITPGLIRISIGIENIDDIIADFDHALLASQQG